MELKEPYKDFVQICRLCLNTKHLTSIYSNSEILKVFQSVTNIEVKSDDNLPKNICKECIKTLEAIEEFITECKKNDSFLRTRELQIQQNVKEETSSETQIESESTELQKFKEEVAGSIENIIFEIIDEPESYDETLSIKEEENDDFGDRLLSDECETKEVLEHFDCNCCNKTFSTIAQLTNHRCKLYKCATCKKKFTSKSALNRHSFLHTGKFKCKTCDTPFTRGSQLKSHLEKAHKTEGSQSYVCKFCGKSYSQKLYLTIHLKSHIEIGAFQCEMCDKDFSLKSLLDRHSMSHPEYVKYNCGQCNRGFRSGAAYKQHIKWHKSGLEVDLTCHGCGKVYRISTRLKEHLDVCPKINTAPIQDFLCSTCGLKFPEKRKLLNHARTHKTMQQFQCHICGNNFAYKDSLNQHLNSHKGEKPYTCPYCEKSFQRTSYYRHIRMHKNVRKHKCTFCDKTFYRTDLLKQHLGKHKIKKELLF